MFEDVTETKAGAGQYLTFFLGEQMYGVTISSIREINRMTEITPVPQMPTYVAGVINLRGKVISVVDLRVKFAMAPSKPTKQTCIIVIEGESGQVGMIVDSVSGVIDLTASQIEAPPAMNREKGLSYLTGIGKLEAHVVILLDIVTCLSHPNIEQAA